MTAPIDRSANLRRLLLIDDDHAFRQALVDQLQLVDNFQCWGADSGKAALEIVSRERFDALLLDVGLPDIDGREVCRSLRLAGVTAPILMLTGAASEAEAIRGLGAGANDYVTKPFRLGVLLARLRAQMRQHRQSENAVLIIGSYCFYPGSGWLIETATRKKIRLTEKETAILKFLYRGAPHLVDRDTLLDEVWGYSANATSHTLETHIYRLRQKIERDPAQPEILITKSRGYCLVA